MISRILLAMFGAGAITITLLFFMNDMVNRFVLRDRTQYFAITDFIRAPDPGRQLPDVPIIPEAAPDRPELELEDEGALPLELVPLEPELELVVPVENQPVLGELGGP
jgi:hypothetical protein